MVVRGASIEDREIRPNVASQIDTTCDKTDLQCEEAARKNRDRQFRKREGGRWREMGGRPPRHAAICILTCTAIIATFAKRQSLSKQASMMRCGPLAAFVSTVRLSMFYTGFRHNLSVFSRKNPVVRRLSSGRIGMHKSIDLGSSQDRFFGHHGDHDLCFNGEVSSNPTATRTRPRKRHNDFSAFENKTHHERL